MIRKILITLAVGLIIIQFFQIDKTSNTDQSNHLNTKFPVPEDVGLLLKMPVTIVTAIQCNSHGTAAFNP